jgi:4-amino-4-deoxy-L-arabinose transferase-like glycosyltransferase
MHRFFEGPWAYVALLACCLALFLPGLTTLPPFDRDEARFAQASKQMLEMNDFIRIKFQDEDRHKKPVGIYWMQALAAKATAMDALWPYRLPSILGAMLAVLLTFHLGRRAFAARSAFLAAALLACSLLLVVEAHLAKTDAMLLASITAMQVALGACYIRKPQDHPPGWGLWLLFWGGMGLSVLLKGPVGPIIAGLTVTALLIADRKSLQPRAWLKGLRPAAGLLLVTVMVAPWLWAVTAATQGTFVADAVTKDLLPKLISGHESHGAPPGLYFLLFTLTFWPGSLLAWPALAGTWQRRSQDRLVRFLWAWIIPAWIMFELVPTKLPHYILPAYPAVALLIAAWLDLGGKQALSSPSSRLFRWLTQVGTILWAVIGTVLALGLLTAPVYMDKSLSLWGSAAALTICATTVLAWRSRLQSTLRTCVILLIGATLAFGLILGRGLPELRGFWVSRSVQQTVEFLRAEHPELSGTIAAAGFHEPSLVFLLGTTTRLVNHSEAARHLADNPAGLALVEARREQEFQDSLVEQGISAQRLAIVRGFNYSKGQWVSLGVYGRK